MDGGGRRVWRLAGGGQLNLRVLVHRGKTKIQTRSLVLWKGRGTMFCLGRGEKKERSNLEERGERWNKGPGKKSGKKRWGER